MVILIADNVREHPWFINCITDVFSCLCLGTLLMVLSRINPLYDLHYDRHKLRTEMMIKWLPYTSTLLLIINFVKVTHFTIPLLIRNMRDY